MTTGSWIPTKDADFDTFTNNFKALVSASPTTYGLTSTDATNLSTNWTNWHTAYLTATTGSTRTHGSIEAKNQQKANLLGVVRGYAATIRANKAVTNQAKLDLGLTVADHSPTPVPPPATYPVLAVDSFNLGTLQLHASDQNTPDKRARPAGTSGLLLFSVIGTAPATQPVGLDFNAFLTKPKFSNSFDQSDSGKTVTYFGRWTNGKGELGPWSPPVSIRIAA